MEQFVVRTPALSGQSEQAVFPASSLYMQPKCLAPLNVAGQKVYGIDKTLLVPLVQPSVDIIQGQVCQARLAIVHALLTFPSRSRLD